MSQIRTEQVSISTLIVAKLKDYVQLFKFRLSLLVVFSSAIGYLLAADGAIYVPQFLLLLFAGFAVTASSNAVNQVIEKDFDKLMKRTQNRPLPQDRMSVMEALLTAGIFGVGGILIFWIYFNQLSAVLSAVALLSYAFIYTPLKRFSPAAVLVGAFPGALPPLIGWIAATGEFSAFAILLFAIQFIWQLPHFWAIAWVAWDDYLKAGYRLLPSKGGRNKISALQNIIYILVLIPVSLLPAVMGLTGIVSTIIILITGLVFLFQSVNLFRKCTLIAARQLMFGSFFYLPIVLLAIYFDRI